MINSEINKFLSIYSLFEPFEGLWFAHEHNDLTWFDMFFIREVKKSLCHTNQDSIQLDKSTIIRIAQILEKNREYFKEWLILKFQFSLIKRSKGIEYEEYLQKPIVNLNLTVKEKLV